MAKAKKATVLAKDTRPIEICKAEKEHMLREIIGSESPHGSACLDTLHWLLHVVPTMPRPDISDLAKKDHQLTLDLEEIESVKKPASAKVEERAQVAKDKQFIKDEMLVRLTHASQFITDAFTLAASLDSKAAFVLTRAYNHARTAFVSTRCKDLHRPESCLLCYNIVLDTDPRRKLHHNIPYHNDDYIKLVTDLKRALGLVAKISLDVPPRKLYDNTKQVAFLGS